MTGGTARAVHRLLGAAIIIVGLVACTTRGPSSAAVTRALERAGVDHDLAVCVASAASSQLDQRARRALTRDPGSLPPDLNQRVTTMATRCALATTGLPSTTTTTTGR